MKQSFLVAFAWWHFALHGVAAVATHPTPNAIPSSVRFYSGTTPLRPTPDTTVLQNRENAALLLACQSGATVRQLHRRGITNVEAGLDALEKARIILRRNDRCFPAFPVVIGKDYEKARTIARAASSRVMRETAKAVAELSQSVRNDAILFHLLWSRVLDQSWEELWAKALPGTPGPTETTWIIYPTHAYSVGTNFNNLPGDGDIAVSWSPKGFEHVRAAMLLRYDIALAAWKLDLPSSAVAGLRDIGFVDNSGAFMGFGYHAGDRLDVLLGQLRRDYATAVTGALNLKSASRLLQISESDALIILVHEVAYCLLEALDRSGILRYPEALRYGKENGGRALVSARLNERPVKADHAIAAFIRRAGRGDRETVDTIRDALRSDPSNRTLWMYLGLSLYEMAEYAAALDTFRKLYSLDPIKGDEEERRMHEWSRIWMGHMQDLLGLRDEAVQSYRAVLNGVTIMQHAQYGIGPISAGDWSRQRLAEPFRRR
jgi:tetratricopeptide (TPR) repeat protein